MAAHRQPIFEKDGTLWWGIAAGFLFTAEFILVYWGLEFTDASRAAIFINISPFIDLRWFEVNHLVKQAVRMTIHQNHVSESLHQKPFRHHMFDKPT